MADSEFIWVTLTLMLPFYSVALVTFVLSLFYACGLFKRKTRAVSSVESPQHDVILSSEASSVQKKGLTAYCKQQLPTNEGNAQAANNIVFLSATEKNADSHCNVATAEIKIDIRSLQNSCGPSTSTCRIHQSTQTSSSTSSSSLAPVHESGTRSQQETSLRSSSAVIDLSNEWAVRNQLRNNINLYGSPEEDAEAQDILTLYSLYGIEKD